MALVRSTRTLPVRRWALDPFEEFDRFFSEAGNPMVSRGEAMYYPMDLYETDEDLVLELAVPGLRSEDIEVSIEGRQLSIRATLPEVGDGGGRRYWMQGIPRGEMSRTVRLPASVDVEAIRAGVEQGLLTLTMPKQAAAKVRKIAIDAH
jgi:HSP20 family protein